MPHVDSTPTNRTREILGERIVVIGASGSGKTILAQALGDRLMCDVIGLDRIHWNGKVTVARDESEAVGMVADAAAAQSWIIEGVFGWLAAPALPRATALIWLDLPWTICKEGLVQRGPWAGATDNEHGGFLEWAEAYWTRQTPSSFAGHQALFDAFDGYKLRLRLRSEIAAVLAEKSATDPC